MDLKLLRRCLLEELGRLHHSTLSVGELLPDIERAIGWQGMLDPVAQCEARQLETFRRMFKRFESVPAENFGPALAGLLAEVREDLSRQSNVYPPAAVDFRLLAGLAKLLHYKIAVLRSAILAARLIGTREIEEEFERCLGEESENIGLLIDLAGNTLHLCCADSSDEIARAMTHTHAG
ncbi:MAG: DUF892 family protein [Terrimicrobiaceae bacterium]|nr:DUF892 family protein [Terrimicrobiaceae bacterium]